MKRMAIAYLHQKRKRTHCDTSEKEKTKIATQNFRAPVMEVENHMTRSRVAGLGERNAQCSRRPAMEGLGGWVFVLAGLAL